MHTIPFSTDLFAQVHLGQQVLMSSTPCKTGCHVWKPVNDSTKREVEELNPDVVIECYLDAQYYHYDPVELTDLPENYVNFAHLANSDDVVTVRQAEMENVYASPSIDDNFKDLVNACPSWEQNIEMMNPKWLDSRR